MTKKAPACVRRYRRAKSRKPRSIIEKLPRFRRHRGRVVHLMHFAVGKRGWQGCWRTYQSAWRIFDGSFGLANKVPTETAFSHRSIVVVESVHAVFHINREGIVCVEPPRVAIKCSRNRDKCAESRFLVRIAQTCCEPRVRRIAERMIKLRLLMRIVNRLRYRASFRETLIAQTPCSDISIEM